MKKKNLIDEYRYRDYCPKERKRTPHIRVLNEKRCLICGHTERRL